MSPPKLTPEQKKASDKRRKDYLKNYHKGNIEQKRIYNRTQRRKKRSKQVLQNKEISI